MTDDEWAFVAPYLTLMREDAPRREHRLRDILDAARWLVETGGRWRYLPGVFPPWPAVYQQARRWLAAGRSGAMAHDLREVLRLAAGRNPTPPAASLDGRTIPPTPTSGAEAGYDGHNKRSRSEVHMAVDTPGRLPALPVTPARDDERAQVAEPAAAVQEATGQTVTLACVDRGYTGDQPAAAAAQGSPWRWSSTRRRSGGSYSCRGGGWRSGRSVGWPGSAGWPATTSGWPSPRPSGPGSRSCT